MSNKAASRKTIAAIVVAILIIGIIGGAYYYYSGTKPSAPPKESFTIAYAIDAVTMDPHVTWESTGQAITSAAYDRLIVNDPVKLTEGVYEAVPQLAKSWDVSSDGLTYTFYLADNAKFASGNPVDASAVKFTLERALKVHGMTYPFFAPIKSVEVVDAKTVKVILSGQNSPFLKFMTSAFGAIIDPSVMEHEQNGDLAQGWLAEHSAGSGPYILDHWTRGVEVVLVRNPNYWQNPPSFEKIVIKDVPESAQQLMMLQRGDVDIAMNLQLDQLEIAGSMSGLKTVSTTAPLSIIMAMNPFTKLADGRKPFEDNLVRQAVKYAIDYDGLVSLVRNNGFVNQGFIHKGFEGIDPKLAYYYHRDVAKAKQLLAQAGYPDGFETSITIPPGTSFTMKWEDFALKLQSDLAEAGIKADIRVLSWATLFELVFTPPRVQVPGIHMMYTYDDFPDVDEFGSLLMSSKTGHYRTLLGWENGTSRGVELDNMVDQARATTNLEARSKLYQDLNKAFLEDSPVIELLQVNMVIAAREGVQGIYLNMFWGGGVEVRLLKWSPT